MAAQRSKMNLVCDALQCSEWELQAKCHKAPGDVWTRGGWLLEFSDSKAGVELRKLETLENQVSNPTYRDLPDAMI